MDNDTQNDQPHGQVNFNAPACLRKWPSLNNQRSPQAPSPYLVLDGTLDECLREFMAKPPGSRHLYEIHTQAQPPLVQAVLTGAIVPQLARLREFL
jgi:hypothetical protein